MMLRASRTAVPEEMVRLRMLRLGVFLTCVTAAGMRRGARDRILVGAWSAERALEIT